MSHNNESTANYGYATKLVMAEHSIIIVLLVFHTMFSGEGGRMAGGGRVR